MVKLVLSIAVLAAGLLPAASASAQSIGGENRRGQGGYLAGDGAYGEYHPQARKIACESWRFQPATCPVDTRGGVRLVQQTGGICTQGQTWGFTPRGIWVNNGCRAIFAAVGRPGSNGGRPGFGPDPGGRSITCESWRFQPARCAVGVVRRPRIEVIAGTCVEHRTWGWNRGGIWVNGGCRARFRLA